MTTTQPTATHRDSERPPVETVPRRKGTFPAPGLSPGEIAAAFRAEPHRYLDGCHSQLAYRRFGQRPDLVFIHGWPLHSAT